MIRRIRTGNLDSVLNPSFRGYAEMFAEIEDQYRSSVESFGLPFEEGPREACALPSSLAACAREGFPLLPEGLARYLGRGLTVANDGKSLIVGWQSDACTNCRLGLRAKTFLLSTQCPRRCFFCFNSNQVDCDVLQKEVRDAAGELAELHGRGAVLTHLALTGGEPLMHRDEALAFFRTAHELYPDAHKRLYTSGALIDDALMAELRDAELDEIRFSIKTEDPPESIDALLEVVRRTTAYVPDVMVEMPVVPGELGFMEDLLIRLDSIGVRGINLLELGYPFANAGEFAKRGLKIKADPMRILYDYHYAGGLPIAGSEEDCLSLLEFALDEGLRMGVHYCSMENKFTGQVFQQNTTHAGRFPFCTMSERDHFLKSAKVFGRDVPKVRALLASKPTDTIRFDATRDLLEFHPSYVHELAAVFPDMEVAISYGIVELRGGERLLRELRIDKTTPATFDASLDL